MSRVFSPRTGVVWRVVLCFPRPAHDLSAERFAREIRLSAQLQHPNIVPVLAAGAARTCRTTRCCLSTASRCAPGCATPAGAILSRRRWRRQRRRPRPRLRTQSGWSTDIAENVLPVTMAVVADWRREGKSRRAHARCVPARGHAHAGWIARHAGIHVPEQVAGDPATTAPIHAQYPRHELLSGRTCSPTGNPQALVAAHRGRPRPLDEAALRVPPAERLSCAVSPQRSDRPARAR
jgi:hypothetical protein